MNTFWFKMMNLLLFAGLLLGYNAVLDHRTQAENIDQLQAELETMKLREKQWTDTKQSDLEQADAPYADGEYEGSAQGFGGTITVKVTIEKGMMTDIIIVSATNEDRDYLEASSKIVNEILDKQTDQVDTVSGATFSSTGIRNAVTEALNQAKR